jgi:hypothetical protein
LRAGAGLRALFTAGENGDAILEVPGDCATVLSLKIEEVDPGVTARLLLVLTKSSFVGISP